MLGFKRNSWRFCSGIYGWFDSDYAVRGFVSKSSPKLNLDGLSCDEIKKSFLLEKFGKDALNEKSSDYISAAFDTFKKINHVSNADSDGKVVAQHKQSSNGDSISAAREAAMQRNIQAGRK